MSRGDAFAGMNRVYFETRFAVNDTWGECPAEFAIVSAYATTGQTWTARETAAAHARLTNELNALGVWMRAITGYSPTTGHAEPGWAVALGFEAACELGRRYRQDAIYFVRDDVLSVSYCDARRGLVPVGGFRERLDSPGR